MSLLYDIQAAVLQEKSDLAPILLKLRLLAARLDSGPLAEWVRHESEGYPTDSEIPKYRIIPVSYKASFSGPFGSGIQNAPISPYIIEKFAGESWVRYEIRQSIAAIDELLESSAKEGFIGIDASDLILLLQGKVYPDYACNAVSGTISRSCLAEIRHSVRSRVLELTIELEKSIPESKSVGMGKSDSLSKEDAVAATQIAQQVIYGGYTSSAGRPNGV